MFTPGENFSIYHLHKGTSFGAVCLDFAKMDENGDSRIHQNTIHAFAEGTEIFIISATKFQEIVENNEEIMKQLLKTEEEQTGFTINRPSEDQFIAMQSNMKNEESKDKQEDKENI